MKQPTPSSPTPQAVGADDPAFLRLFYGLPPSASDPDVQAYVEAAREETETARAADTARARLAALDRALRASENRALRPAVDLPGPALHGLLGAVVRTMRAHNEACDGSVLAQAIAAVSAIVGPRPYVAVGATRHPARISPLVIGTTGHGRKGTALDAALAVFKHRDGPGLPRIVSNVQSGEAIVEAVRDGDGLGEDSLDPGVDDKRLLCLETEFGNVLAAKGRTGSTLTGVIRQAFDSGDLANTKIRAVAATGAHVVFCAHVTPDELHDASGRTDVSNGFSNRFLHAHSQAVRSIPLPKPPPDDVLGALARQLARAVGRARRRDRVGLSAAALAMWHRLYPHLDTDDEGAVGALLARTKPYLLRLALVYGLLDEADEIEPVHLRAACAVWDYHTATVRRVYGGRTGNALDDRVLNALREAGGEADRTTLYSALSGHVSAAALNGARGRLEAAGAVEVDQVETGGRPREVWRASEASGGGPRPTLTSLSSHFAEVEVGPVEVESPSTLSHEPWAGEPAL